MMTLGVCFTIRSTESLGALDFLDVVSFSRTNCMSVTDSTEIQCCISKDHFFSLHWMSKSFSCEGSFLPCAEIFVCMN